MNPAPGSNTLVPARAERRKARSNNPLVALSRLLDAVRKAKQLDALAVADDSGCLVAGAGPFRVCQELAAFAPLSIRSVETDDPEPDLLFEMSEVKRLVVDGLEMLVCGQGPRAARQTGMAEVAQGCSRILAARALP